MASLSGWQRFWNGLGLSMPQAAGKPAPATPSPWPRAWPRVEPLEDRTLLSVGNLDPLFQLPNLITANLGSVAATAVTVQPNGVIYAAGTSGAVGRRDLVINAFNPNGSVVLGFGTQGARTLDLGGDDVAGGLALQKLNGVDGLVVALTSTVGSTSVLELARFRLDGSLDTAFGQQGVARLTLSGASAGATALAVDGQGVIYVGGFVTTAAQAQNFLVTRFTANGTLDSSFGMGGVTQTSFGPGSAALHGLALQTDSGGMVTGVVAAGTAAGAGGTTALAVARWHANGTVDASFHGTGQVLTAVGQGAQGNAVAVQADGKIVVAGSATDGHLTFVAVARYRTDGSLDTAFQPGAAQQGQVAAAFAPAGVVTTSVGAVADVAQAITLQPNGRIVVAGRGLFDTTAGRVSRTILVRYLDDGSEDGDFGINGQVVTAFGDGGSAATAVAVSPTDGRLVVVGGASVGGTLRETVARYIADVAPIAADDLQVLTQRAANQRFNVLANDFDVDGDALTLTGFTVTADPGTTAADFALVDNAIQWAKPGAFTGNVTVTYTVSDGWVTTTGTLRIRVLAATGNLAGDRVVGLTRVVDFASTIDQGTALTLDSSGRLLLAGTVQATAGGPSDFGLTRFVVPANGSATQDTTFGTAGKVQTDFGGDDVATAILVQGGYVFVAGSTDAGGTRDFLLAWYDEATGALVGSRRLDFGGADVATALAVQNGKLLVGGTATVGGVARFAFARFTVTPGGVALDTTFGGGTGQLLLSFQGAASTLKGLAVQDFGGGDQRLVAAGSTQVNGFDRVALVRLNAAGQVDTTFGQAGWSVTDVGPGDDRANAVVVVAGNKIVIAGSSLQDHNGRSDDDLLIARFTAAGALDPTFNDQAGADPAGNPAGTLLMEFAGGTDVAYAVAVDAQGRLAVAGKGQEGNHFDLIVAHVNADGTPDANFGGLVNGQGLGGMAGLFNRPDPVNQPTLFEDLQANGVLVLPDGRIAAAAFIDLSTMATQDDFFLIGFFSDPTGDLPPVALDDVARGVQVANGQTPVPIRDIRVLDNDTDLNGQALTVTAATAAGGGTVVINADGTLTYTPSAATNASGSDTITYTVTDGTTSVQAQVVVTLVPPPSRATTGEILGPAVQDFQWTALSSGTAAGFYQGTIGYGPQAVSGQFLVISNGDLASVLDSSRAGTDNHTRTGAGGYDVTTLQLTIAVPAGANFVSLDFAFLSNEFPLFTSGQGGVGDFNDAFLVEIGGSTFEVDPVTGAITAPNNVAYDAKDPGRTPLTVNSAFFGATRVQTLTGTALNGGTPLLRVGRVLQPGDVINGQVKVYVTVLDAGDGEIDSAAFLRSVQTGVVDPSLVHDGITQVPLAADDWAALHKGQPVTIPVLANDVDFDGNPLQIVGASGAQHGKLTINPNGTITYVAEAGYKGDDAFTYVVRNPAGQVSTATVRLYGLVTSTSSTSLLPTASGQVGTTLALVSLANGAVGNGATPVTVSDYAGNPVGGTQTGVFFDIQGLNATTSHRAVVEVDAPNGGTLVFWDGTGWQPVRSSGNTDPIKLPNGKFLVVLDGTSFPRITALTGTVFSVGTDAGGGAGGGGGGGTPTVTASLASGSLSGFSSRLSDGGAGSGLSGFGQSNGFRGPAQVTLVVTAVQDSRATSDLASQSGSDEQRGLTDDERLAYLQFLVDTHPQDPFKLWMLGGDEALWLWFRQAQGKPPAVAPKKKDAGRDNTAIDPVAPPELVQVTGLLEEPMAAEAGPWVQPAEPPATVLPTEAPAPPTLVTPVERAAAPEATAPWAGLAGLLLAGLVQPALAQDENRRRRPARG